MTANEPDHDGESRELEEQSSDPESQYSTPTDRPDAFDDPTFHLDTLDDLVAEADCDGAVPLASFPDNRYPYAYPRDVASITRAWLASLEAGVRPDACRSRVVDAARFLLAAQDDGQWYQRYTLDGTEQALYHQEDNVAHGIRILCHAVTALDGTDSLDAVEESFSIGVRDALTDAVEHTRESLYDPNAHLVESTTSIHEGRIESGYTLWVNCAFVAALRQAKEAADSLPDSGALRSAVESFRPTLERGVERAFAGETTVPRRYTPDGDRDERPDVTLFAPFYFGLDDLFGEHVEHAAERAASSLHDPELDGLQRFQGLYGDFDVHQHGGTGPWMQYTAWHAQYRFEQGDVDRGDAVLRTVADHADERGHIPEHLTTAERFESFLETEWHTGLDYEKEFDDAVLRDIPFDRVVEELGHMKDSYDAIADEIATTDVVSFANPLAWCHAEYLSALLCRRTAVRNDTNEHLRET
ncbi:glucoamylase [Haladaptatus sp. NG-WS-4]